MRFKGLLLSVLLFWAFPAAARPLLIGAKNFTENTLLAEMIALILEENFNTKVKRNFNMGGTKLVFSALQNGEIDVYPEYTGTGYTMILKLSGRNDPKSIYQIVKKQFAKKQGLIWSLPLGFENTYTLAVKASDLRFKQNKSISSLQKQILNYRLAMGHEFAERKDGFKNFSKRYNLKFKPENVFAMNESLMYPALEEGKVDMIMAYSTSGKIKAFNLRPLKDDQNFFPAYEAAFLTSLRSLKLFPQIAEAFKSLEGQISEEEMTDLNNKADSLKIDPTAIAKDFLIQKNILLSPKIHQAKSAGLAAYYFSKRHYFLKILMEHLALTFTALLFAILFAVPVGVWAARRPKAEKVVFAVVNILQTIPSLALLGLLIPLMGIGFAPAAAALFVYSLLPLIQNTCEGVKNIDRKFIEAAASLGLSRWHILRFVQAPLAWPFMLAGVKTAAVWTVGTATLAAFVGAGGLGDPIFKGIATLDSRLIFLGAAPAALLALAFNLALSGLEKLTVSKGLQLESDLKQIAFK